MRQESSASLADVTLTLNNKVEAESKATAVLNVLGKNGKYTKVKNLSFASANTTQPSTSLSMEVGGGLAANTTYQLVASDITGFKPNGSVAAHNFTFKIKFTTASSAPPPPTPSVSGSGSPTSGTAPLGVNFTAAGTETGGSITGYSWNFGDGSAVSTTQNPSHTYTASGSYTATVTATDANSKTATATVGITVSAPTGDTTPPTVSITSPTAGATVSQTVTVSANASDNVGVVGVQFILDGQSLDSEVTTAPYSVTWDTTTDCQRITYALGHCPRCRRQQNYRFFSGGHCLQRRPAGWRL